MNRILSNISLTGILAFQFHDAVQANDIFEKEKEQTSFATSPLKFKTNENFGKKVDKSSNMELENLKFFGKIAAAGVLTCASYHFLREGIDLLCIQTKDSNGSWRPVHYARYPERTKVMVLAASLSMIAGGILVKGYRSWKKAKEENKKLELRVKV